MTRTATLKVFNGSNWQFVTGHIVKMYDNESVTIDDARNVRHFATKDRATINSDGNAAQIKGNTLW